MTETAKEALDRFARAFRADADALEARHREKFKEVRSSRAEDADYQKGCMDTLRDAAKHLDEKEGK